jgi:hypothetical protein
MAIYYTNVTAARGSNPIRRDPPATGAGIQRGLYSAQNLAALTAAGGAAFTTGLQNGDRVLLGYLPVGAVILSTNIVTDTSFGTATVAIGSEGTPGKYRAAAVLTTTNAANVTPYLAVANNDGLTAKEAIYMTIGTANAPTTGICFVHISYLLP